MFDLLMRLMLSFTDYMTNGKWEQNFLFPGGSSSRNMSASSSPMSTMSSNYRVGGGSYTAENTTYMIGPGRNALGEMSS